MAVGILTFEEQANRVALDIIATPAPSVPYEEDIPALAGRRLYRISAQIGGGAGAVPEHQPTSGQQGPELNNLLVNGDENLPAPSGGWLLAPADPGPGPRFYVDFQVHPSPTGGTRLVLSITTDEVAPTGDLLVDLTLLRFRMWEQVNWQAATGAAAAATPGQELTQFLAVEDAHLPVADRLNLSDYLALLPGQPVLAPRAAGAGWGIVPVAADPPDRVLLAVRTHAVQGGLTRIVTCEYTDADAGDPTPLP